MGVLLGLRGHAELQGAVRELLHEYASAEVVLLRLELPKEGSGLGEDSVKLMSKAVRRQHPELFGALQGFIQSCRELTDRSKRRKRECTNVC